MCLSQKEKTRIKWKYGPWALITWASSGIGREMALVLADAGLNLVLTARRGNLLESLEKEIQEKYKTQTHIIEADLAHPEEVTKVIDECAAFYISLAVLNAGFGSAGEFIQLTAEEDRDMLMVNCAAVLQMSHHFAPLLAAKKKGGIIFVSSVVGFQGSPYATHYAATKAYVQSLGEGLAYEMKNTGVDILIAAPGPVNTGFGSTARMDMGNAQNSRTVALSIIRALGKSRIVYPGWLSKLLAHSLQTLPRFLKIKVMGLVMKWMAHK